MTRFMAFLAAALLGAAPAFAQLVEPNQIGLRMGHVHLAVTDVEAHKQFWIGLLGGTLVRNGPLELIQFPGAYIMLRKVDAPAPANTTAIVNHFGFTVKDMPASLARWRAAGVKIEPLPENPNEVYLYAPDDVKVEVYGEPALSTPIRMNHIHYYAPDIPAIKRWYVNAFGANPGQRPCIACISKPRMIEADDLPGVNLTFAAATAPVVDRTRGHSLDHVGFDVTNLEEMVKSLEARGIKIDAPIRQVPGSRVKVAFLSDPWGTYIELTEGLTP
jgi:catechol 2,3-dioxygenase-like lactoylglutathione lyase family enzyme